MNGDFDFCSSCHIVPPELRKVGREEPAVCRNCPYVELASALQIVDLSDFDAVVVSPSPSPLWK